MPIPNEVRRVFTDAELLALSDVCWFCGAGDPVAVHDGCPTCEKCRAAFREATPIPGAVAHEARP